MNKARTLFLLCLLLSISTPSFAKGFFLGTQQGLLIPMGEWSKTYNTGGFISPRFGYEFSNRFSLLADGMVGFQGVSDRVVKRYKSDYEVDNVDLSAHLGLFHLTARYRLPSQSRFRPNIEIGYGIFFYDLNLEIESLDISHRYVDNSWGNGFNLGAGVHYHFGETRKNSIQFYLRYFHNFQDAEIYYRNLDETIETITIGEPVRAILLGIAWELGDLR
jgi:opacity protein-like surface antigen